MDSRYPNGPRNGVEHQTEGQMDPHKSITRPFTLQEALPFSPQTSTIPFVPDIIPDPSLGSGSPALRISDIFPSHEFDKLNREAAAQSHLPKNAKQAVDLVLQDLKPAQRTHYNFAPLMPGHTNSRARKKASSDLSPLTKAVFDKVGNVFKITKPNPLHAPHMNGQHATGTKKELSPYPSGSVTPASTASAQNQQAYRSNSRRIEVAIPTKKFDPSSYVDARDQPDELAEIKQTVTATAPAPVPAPVAQVQVAPSNLPLAVPIPPTAAPFARASLEPKGSRDSKTPAFRIELTSKNIDYSDYLEVADLPETPLGLSVRKNAGQGASGAQVFVGESLDQRQRGDAALDALDKFIRSIASATGHALAGDTAYEHVVCLNPAGEPTMTSSTQQKLQGSIHKVIDLKCYNQVPVENLLQIMRLSDNTLKQVDDLELRVDENWDEPAFDLWVQQLAHFDTAFKAARTCLRVLSGGREDKQLYSEGIIKHVIDLFKTATEDMVMPIVELRSSGPGSGLFRMLSKQKKTISGSFSLFQKLFSLLAELVTKVEFSESILNALEYTASRLIFVENAHVEKESAVGVQKFDGIRSTAMDMLCQIFLIKPDQRQGIIDEILTSLEKLPVGKQSSRQFKMADGGSIQPVSALIMRLIQASSRKVDMAARNKQSSALQELTASGDNTESHFTLAERHVPLSSIKSEEQGGQQHATAIQDLEALAAPLNDAATRNASYVINFIVTRAVRSTKSGDTPYRNLLDLFVEDFTLCMDSPDWPSAEILLRLLMVMMIQLFEAPKTAAPTKNMALELLGNMSSAISRLRFHVKKLAASLEGGDSDELSRYLSDLATHVIEHKGDMDHIIGWAGPYRTTLESLQSRANEDPHLSTAISLLIVDWATRLHTTYDSLDGSDPERDEEYGRMSYRLRMMIDDRQWLANEWTYKTVASNQAKLAHAIILLKSPLCESFNKILQILLESMASDQATVRSKSLKSISQVLETDPSILDGQSNVIELILDRAEDSSPQVRDSALGLLGTCLGMRPALETGLTPKIIARFQDAGIGVRKRAMKLARDIYLRNRNKGMRSAIANGLLRRIQDPDEGVRDLARQMMEEIWFAPFYYSESTAQFETSLTEHVALIIQTVKTGAVTETLDKVFHAILKPGNRSLDGPFSVCKKVVANMFGLLDNLDPEDAAVPSGRDALQVLTMFAKAEPKLFNFEQIRMLRPQLTSFSGPEELAAFRAVTVIYRLVLPQLPAVHSDFVLEVRLQLQKGVGKIFSRLALDDLIACMKVCCDLLKDLGPLANVVASALLGIEKLPKSNLPAKGLQILSAYAMIAGCVAKHCDLDEQKAVFKAKFPRHQVEKVTRLIIDILSPYMSTMQPVEARKASLEAIGLVCQAWPRNYQIPKVYTAFQQVFQEKEPLLEALVMRSFKEFLMTEEKRSETSATEGDVAEKKKKELTVMGGTNFDDVASALAQRFLKDITRIALSNQDDHAFQAMEVLGSINRQGLTHPKETGVTLITLETSSNRKIAELAFVEHRSLHEKHETVLEREYVKATQSAYNYQRDIVQDSHGATTDPFQSKLHLLMEVLKISKLKNRQRFLEKMCGQADFDLPKLSEQRGAMQHVDFSRFILENLAYFEYQTVGEIQAVVNAIEKIVSSTGATVAQAIESEVFHVRMDLDQPEAVTAAEFGSFDGQNGADTIAVAPQVDPNRLYQLTVGAIVLLAMWEVRTYLRRLYGMGTNRHDSKAKALAKDLNKSPVKVQGIHGDKVWDEMAAHLNGLQGQDAMVGKCRAFVELMNVDKEFKVVEEEDEMGVGGPATPSGGEDDDDDEGVDRGRKRKAAGTPGGRKKRQRSNSQPRKRGRPRKNPVAEQDDESDAEGDWF